MNFAKAYDNLLSAKRVLDALGIRFWLDGGTCLGAIRENSFLSSDFDVDIGILGECAGLLPKVVLALREDGWQHFHLKEHPCGEGKQLSCIRHGISMDIFVYYLRGDKRWRLMFDITPLKTVRYFACVYPKHIFESFREIDFCEYGVEFMVPEQASEYLRMQYGDWKTDKTRHQFRWQHDYKSMDLRWEIYDKPRGVRRWYKTETLKGEEADGSFFTPLLKEGFKIYPIVVDRSRKVIDGNKRLAAYKKLGIPMVECYIA